MNETPWNAKRVEAKQNEPAEKIRPSRLGAIAVLTSVAKRRNLLGLANTLAKELNEAEELVRRF